MRTGIMKSPTFLQGVVVAFVLSFFGAALFAALTTIMSTGGALRTLVALTTLAYVGYLLSRSRARVGRITALAFSIVVAGIAWGVELPMGLYLIVHVALIWLIRSLYFYSGVLPSLMDLGLSALALAAAVWATLQAGSVFLAVWCFLLVQALHVAIPASIGREQRGREGDPSPSGDARFQRARRTAEAAITRLIHEH
ncbi:MAG: hypothetical protein V3U43_07115 [Pseudomonadales bacterium]